MTYLTEDAAATMPGADRPAARALLLGIGTAVPHNQASQLDALNFALNVAKDSPNLSPALIKRIYKHSGIERRHSVVDDYLKLDPSEFEFFPKNWNLDPAPGTAARMDVYENTAVELAAQAAEKAMATAGIDSGKITHLVISTCTGFFAPGPDVLLLRRLGIPTTAQRTVLGFMGCYAGISGIRACQQITRANPSAVVLQIAIELCSLHYQTTPTVETIVSNAIFSDGAAAAVYCGDTAAETLELTDASAIAEVISSHSDISPESLDRMSWRISDHGFIMTLDAGVPEILQDHARSFASALAASADLAAEDISGWAIHPGGRKIIEAVASALNLSEDDVRSSTETLRNFGNMSSATILFVLQQEIARRCQGDVIATVAFGPGLTLEGALLTVQ